MSALFLWLPCMLLLLPLVLMLACGLLSKTDSIQQYRLHSRTFPLCQISPSVFLYCVVFFMITNLYDYVWCTLSLKANYRHHELPPKRVKGWLSKMLPVCRKCQPYFSGYPAFAAATCFDACVWVIVECWRRTPFSSIASIPVTFPLCQISPPVY